MVVGDFKILSCVFQVNVLTNRGGTEEPVAQEGFPDLSFPGVAQREEWREVVSRYSVVYVLFELIIIAIFGFFADRFEVLL